MTHQAAVNVNNNRQINLKAINKYLMGLSAVTLALYIFAVNSLSVQGFALADYKNKLDDIRRENKSLEVKITTIRSYSYLTEKIKSMDLVPVGEIKYINPINTTVAKK